MYRHIFNNTSGEVVKALKEKFLAQSAAGEGHGLAQKVSPVAEPGNIDSWSPTFINVLNITLNSPQPSVVFYGNNDLCFFNDLYLETCGYNFKPHDIGEPASTLFGNRWQTIEPFLRRVRLKGEVLSTKTEQLPALMHYVMRYTPFSYIPFFSANNEVESILVNYQKNEDPEKIYEKIEDTKEELGFAIGAAELGTWDYDPANDYLIVNQRVCEWFGLKAQRLPLAYAVDCIIDKDRHRVVAAITEAIQDGGEYFCEYTIKNPVNGVRRRIIAKGRTSFNEKNEPYRFRGTIQDITPIIHAIQKKEMTEDRLMLALSATSLGMFELFLGKDKINYSPRLAEIFGLDRNAPHIHADFKNLIHNEDREVVNRSFKDSIGTGRYAYEARINKPNGTLAWIKTRGKLYLNEEGKPHKILGTVEDITEDMEYEQKLKESENMLRSFIDTAPFPIAIYEGEDMKITMANRAVIEVWGKGNDIVGKTFLEVLPELQEFDFFNHLQRVYKTGIAFEERNKRVDLVIQGEVKMFYFDYIYTPLFDSQGKVFGVMNTAADITDLVTIKNRLEESEARFRLLADSLPQLIWASDKYGNLDYWNKATFDYCGVSLAQMHSGRWMEVIHPHDKRENIKQWRESVHTGNPFLLEHRFKTADGTYRWQLSRALPLKDENNEIIRWVGSSTDIEEIKEQEKQKDFFISMASHELKTPVTSIKAYVQVLLKKYKSFDDPFLMKSLSSVDKQVQKLTGLIAELLDLSKIKAGTLNLKQQPFVLDELIEETVSEILQSNYGHLIEFQPLTEGAIVNADRERIGQVMLNLLSNAIKYSPNKGDIMVRSKIANDHIMVSIEDKGIGINQYDQTKIFDRFYRVAGTSEETFPGFGIGLYLVKDLISRHEGTVGVESELGKGSVFYFTLPVYYPVS